MTDMVEHVARVLAAEDWRDYVCEFGEDDIESIEDYTEYHWLGKVRHARAAIAAMREPTRLMTQAAGGLLMDRGIAAWEAEGIFEVMIDAALQEDKL